jgi:hypothetical protein
VRSDSCLLASEFFQYSFNGSPYYLRRVDVIAMAKLGARPENFHISHTCGHGAQYRICSVCMNSGRITPTCCVFCTGKSRCIKDTHLVYESPADNYSRVSCHKRLQAGASCTLHDSACKSAQWTQASPRARACHVKVGCLWPECEAHNKTDWSGGRSSLLWHVQTHHGGSFTHPALPTKTVNGVFRCPSCDFTHLFKGLLRPHIERTHFIPNPDT